MHSRSLQFHFSVAVPDFVEIWYTEALLLQSHSQQGDNSYFKILTPADVKKDAESIAYKRKL